MLDGLLILWRLKMSYNAEKKAKLKAVKRLASRVKAITDNHEQRLIWLEELASSLLDLTNSVISNITKE